MPSAYPHGVSSYGLPVMPANLGIPQGRGGQTWFVNNDPAQGGNDSNDGSVDYPLLTINGAIDKASAGDSIGIFAGSYDENVIVDKDYITLFGVQLPGYAKPDIVPSSGIALYNQAAQGLVLRHLRLAAPAEDVDLVLVEGNGFIIEGCVLDGDSTQGNAKALLRLKGNADDDSYTASEGKIRGCYFRGSGGIGIIFDTGNAPNNGVGCTDDEVYDCIFIANDQSDIATADTGGGVYSIQNGYIYRNLFATKNKTNYIDMTTSNGGAAGDQSGSIAGNIFAADAITAGNQVRIVGTLFTFPGNFDTVGVVDGSGLD
jgi:hypothetical protein